MYKLNRCACYYTCNIYRQLSAVLLSSDLLTKSSEIQSILSGATDNQQRKYKFSLTASHINDAARIVAEL